MGSQTPRAIPQNISAPPQGNEGVDDKQDEDEPIAKTPRRTPLNVLGSVKEKGFSTSSGAQNRISFPKPRATPFPVARHRSDGPHWGPSSKPPLYTGTLDTDIVDSGMPGAAVAEPLRRRTSGYSDTSRWQSNRKSNLSVSLQTQNEFDDKRQWGDAQDTSADTFNNDGHGQRGQDTGMLVVGNTSKKHTDGDVCSQKQQILDGDSMDLVYEGDYTVLQKSDSVVGAGNTVTLGQRAATSEKQTSMLPLSEDRLLTGKNEVGSKGRDLVHAKRGPQSVLHSLSSQEIDVENRNAVFAMNSAEIAEAQAELKDRFSAKTLEFLRKRGAAKEGMRHAEGPEPASHVSSSNERDISKDGYGKSFSASVLQVNQGDENVSVPQNDIALRSDCPDAQANVKQRSTVKGTTVGPADLLTEPAVSQQGQEVHQEPQNIIASITPTTIDPWILRVEAVRLMKFDLHGNLMSARDESHGEQGLQFGSTGAACPGGMSDGGEHINLPVLERDFLRMEGDPVGSGYSIKDALALARSTVPGQRAVALRLIASVLEKAIHGLQHQKVDFRTPLSGERPGESVDWQAIWAYALGPEAQLVLTLRLLLDNGHSTAVAACARAIQALLSYTANESYFYTLEGLWPGDKVMFTGPVFRRKTKQEEGFIGGGRWKSNVKESNLFPFSITGEEMKDEDGGATVGDDGHVSNGDVAAGLIRMGVLPRIRYILEVDKFIKAEDELLSVLIGLARHSSLAADAVMDCPRLIETILHRFIGVDGRLPKESYSARMKAIRLLKVLSLARRSHCLHFEVVGALHTVVRSFLQRGHVDLLSEHQETGFYEAVIEAIRFWRVCIDYGIGISLYADCYPTICFWQAPLLTEEILCTANDERLWMVTESYLLLEHISRTLPSLHPSVGANENVTTWPWSVALANVNTAIKLIYPDSILGVHVLLEKYIPVPSEQTVFLSRRLRNILGAVAAVLHFLASVCERVVSNELLRTSLENPEKFPLEWLPTFLPELGLAIARSGLLKASPLSLNFEKLRFSSSPLEMEITGLQPFELQTKYSFLECLAFCLVRADDESALASVNFASALVRVTSIVDKLIRVSRPKATHSPGGQAFEYKILEVGLLRSADADLKNLFYYCRQNTMTRNNEMQLASRGGPAPGLGIGWGSISGGTWSKSALITQAGARLTLDLLSSFALSSDPHISQNGGKDDLGEQEQNGELFTTSFSRLKFGLLVSRISTPINRELACRAVSDFVFHPSILSDHVRRVQNFLKRSKDKTLPVYGPHQIEHNMDTVHLSKLLIQHFNDFWLTSKVKKGNRRVGLGAPPRSRTSSIAGPSLATVDEEDCNEDYVSSPESLSESWAGQRLPLPPHWFLSSLVNNVSQSLHRHLEDISFQVEYYINPEELIEAGLLFFLGFQLELASVSEADYSSVNFSLVRKIHSLSCVFVSGGEVSFDPWAGELLEALQCVIGNQIEKEAITDTGGHRRTGSGFRGELLQGPHKPSTGADSSSTGGTEIEETSGLEWSLALKEFDLNFESSIDPSYVIFAEALAEQFVATSFGSLVFGRQVALYLCMKVPNTIWLAIWRVLADGKVLDLLPPLNDCCGPAQIYLSQNVEQVSQEILDSFVSAWASGGLDKAAKRVALSFTMALHHVALFLFNAIDTTEKSRLLKNNVVRILVRSTVGKSERQQMLSSLVSYNAARNQAAGVLVYGADGALSGTNLKSRVELLTTACEGNMSLMNEIKRLQSSLTSSLS